jgi:hypothetical protein
LAIARNMPSSAMVAVAALVGSMPKAIALSMRRDSRFSQAL